MPVNDKDRAAPEAGENPSPEMIVNDYGLTRDETVVVEEADRTVILTPTETMVIEKEPSIDMVPKDRPRKVYGGMWGQAEIATVGVAVLAVILSLLVYLFLVLPSDRELQANRAERDRLERELATANDKYGNITSTETQVAKLVSSVNDFELVHLPVESVGKNAVYQRINSLIGAYGLVNTSGPDYAPLEMADQNTKVQSDEDRGRSRFRSIFPGIYVTTTLDGSYQNLRRFIADVERSNEFLIISAIELEPADNENTTGQTAANRPPSGQRAMPNVSSPSAYDQVNDPTRGAQTFAQAPRPQSPQGKTHGETVSLRIEMVAYFRRPNFVPLQPISDTTVQQ